MYLITDEEMRAIKTGLRDLGFLEEHRKLTYDQIDDLLECLKARKPVPEEKTEQ